ncbi:MAG: hypothetical protein ABJG14_03890 [Sulfitobacter sp.]|uniref:hypothetical protein n=1 Tax=Alphaproteobacteria TaxID=28211 RepID=UPI001ADC0F99|nr:MULTISPECIES: hypothetical protein [unclassified Sulfitobacter]MBO9430617.1 hypothetical protein [Sulfitobacter sp. R18_1]WPZ30754.1 hypothetical protein T8A63_06755 [Sulfitobacter sp. OXR-159]WPZ30855.1 hypothetical protein T8A63_07265 [Sulfitobacter sp. OXR-159]
MWKTKLTAKDNHIPHEIAVGDDTIIRMVRSGEGVLSIVVDAPRHKTIVRRAGSIVQTPAQEG